MRSRLALALALLLTVGTLRAQDFTTDDDDGGSCTRAFAETVIRLDQEKDDCEQAVFDACQDLDSPQCIQYLIAIAALDNISGTNPADALGYYCYAQYALAVEKAWAQLFWCLFFG